MDQCRRSAVGARQTVILLAGGLAIALLVLWARPLRAQESAPPDSACKECHVGNEGQVTLASGDTLTLDVNLDTLMQSVHGAQSAQPVYCTDCHNDRQRYLYPHAPTTEQNRAEFRAQTSQSCQQCHKSLEVHNPGHLLARNQENLPTCADCHGGHTTAPVAAMKADPVGTCQTCHQEYANQRIGAVHKELAANLQPGQSCQTCHADAAQPVDAQCKTCHSLLTSQITLPSGESVSLNVHAEDILNSVHGDREVQGVKYQALKCTECHQDQRHYGFPHPQLNVDNLRELTIGMERVCQDCHRDIFQKQHDGVHAKAIESGELGAATCSDCHGNHAIHDPDQPRERVSQTCGKCHSTINETYSTSVHGAALLGDGNPDVPVCTDCHGVHDIANPTTTEFRLNSPTLCAGCHADKQKMAKYNISTNVFASYVADFHGTTVTLFEKQSPEQESNKAVCYDCHGIHNILAVTDENSQVIRENLAVTCQKCHPGASANFPAAWTSHFEPSLEHNPLVYLVNLFYQILIPAVLGGFAIFIGSDIFRRFREWWMRRRGKEQLQ